MSRAPDRYEDFVEHPRYGKRPHITGQSPETDFGGSTYIHWHSGPDCRIPGTAIAADESKQQPATIHVTHYYDVTRCCRDCERDFIFFAQEQRHWYEQLGFPLEADAVRCPECRKKHQGAARNHQRYQELLAIESRSLKETLELLQCCLDLMESGTFSRQKGDDVRRWLKLIESEPAWAKKAADLRSRLMALDAEPRE